MAVGATPLALTDFLYQRFILGHSSEPRARRPISSSCAPVRTTKSRPILGATADSKLLKAAVAGDRVHTLGRSSALLIDLFRFVGGHPRTPLSHGRAVVVTGRVRIPSHRGDRFPGCTHEPETDSRHLNAGRRSGSNRIAPELIPVNDYPRFDVIPTLSTLHQWFTCVRLSVSYLTRSSLAFSLTLTT